MEVKNRERHINSPCRLEQHIADPGSHHQKPEEGSQLYNAGHWVSKEERAEEEEKSPDTAHTFPQLKATTRANCEDPRPEGTVTVVSPSSLAPRLRRGDCGKQAGKVCESQALQ